MEPDFPAPLLARNTWSWWRKILKRPPANVRTRIGLWNDLRDLKNGSEKKPELAAPPSTIFGNSRRCWDLLQPVESGSFSLNDGTPGSTWGDKTSFSCPYGPLIQSVSVAHFQCDARDVEGISCSKSSRASHESVGAFGAWFIDEQNRLDRKGRPPLQGDAASLAELCAHDEIRLLHGRNGDFFSVRAWDGRLFIENSGGSHHLAAAAHVAARIGASIPLASRLCLYKLNSLTVKWLLGGFHLVLLNRRLAGPVAWIVKGLVSSGSIKSMPPVFCDATLLAIPKGSAIADCVMAELLDQGNRDLGVDLTAALASQAQVLVESKSPWVKLLSASFGEA